MSIASDYDTKILIWSKLKVFAGEKLTATEPMGNDLVGKK